MEQPRRVIVTYAGEVAYVVSDQIKKGEGAYGYNAATGEFGDMLEMGILDPAKVTRTALQAASSIAGLMITTEAMIADEPDDGKSAAPDKGGRSEEHTSELQSRGQLVCRL